MSARGKRVQKAVVYKRVQFHTSVEGQTLKSLLAAALRKRKTLGERRKNVAAEDDPIYHALGIPKDEPNGFVFGTLMTYTPGTDPLCFIDDELCEEVVLEKVAAPQAENGKRREFLASMMYFGVVDNHMVLMQSQALKAVHLESYLQWYLHASGVLEGTNTLQLLDTPSEALQKKVSQGKGVKAIKIGGQVMPPSIMPPVKDTEGGSAANAPEKQPTTRQVALHTTAVATSEDYGVLAALKKLMRPIDAAKIDFDQLAGSNIEMSVTLRYGRSTTEDGEKLMTSLGAALRNSEDVETEIELIGGGSIKGSELKLKGDIRLTSYDGQLNATDVYEGLRQWLLNKVSSQELPAS